MPVAGEFTELDETAQGMKIAVLPFAKTSRLNVILFVKAGQFDEFIPARLVPKKQRHLMLKTRWGRRMVELAFCPNTDHALEHLVFKGTKKTKFGTIHKIMLFYRPLDREDETGIGAETTEFYVSYYLEWSPKNLDKALEFLAELTLRPKFLDKDPATRKRMERELEKEKGVMMEELGWNQDDLLIRVQEEVRLKMFPGHPLGYSLGGDAKDVITTTLSQVIARHRMRYHPSNMTLMVIGGGAATSTVKRSAEKHFRAPRRKIHAIRFPAPKIRDDVPVKERVTFEATQPVKTYIGIGFPFSRPSTQKEEVSKRWLLKRYAIWLLEKSFAGRWASRPFFELREKRGIGYRYIPLREEFPDAGALTLTTHLYPEKVLPAMKVLLRIFRKLTTHPIGRQELEDAKKSWAQKFASDSETPAEIARFLFHELRLRGKPVMFNQITRAMKSITPQDVLAVAKEIIVPNHMIIKMDGKPPSVQDQRAIERLVENWQAKFPKTEQPDPRPQ